MLGKLFTAEGDLVRSIDGVVQFHPDGKHILYSGALPNQQVFRPELFMEPLDGAGDPIHLSHDASGGPGVRYFTFNSDGSTLLYARSEFGKPLQLYAVHLVPEPSAASLAAAAAVSLIRFRRRA
jgi:hypothetical protein